MLAFLICVCGLFGLAVGSFLNVVIHRVPRNESIVSPGSRCPSCETAIKGYDKIPVLSWLALRGKCRNCDEPIPVRYPLVELGCSLLFSGLAARLGFRIELLAFLAMFAGLLALSVIDIELLVLPKRIVYPTLAVVASLLLVASATSGDWNRMVDAIECSLAWFALFFLMNLASPRILGFGDVRLSLVLGLGLGWLGWRYAILGFFAANLIGALTGLTLIAVKKMSRDQPVPYGVFLALGTGVAIFAGPELISLVNKLH